MNTAPDHREDVESLLQLVSNYRKKDDFRSICVDVLKWFEHSSRNEALLAARETNDYGETALHIMLKNNDRVDDPMRSDFKANHFASNLFGVVKKFVEIDSDAFKIQDNNGCLPLHDACQDRACSFDVIRALIAAYPAGLGVVSSTKENHMSHTPFDWDHAISVGGHFTEFLQYVVADDDSKSHVTKYTTSMRTAQRELLGHCKNWVPLGILKKGMLNEETLESKAMIRWLNEMPCKRSVVCSMVFELYLHIAWIVVFIYTTIGHIEDDQNIQGWEPKVLLAFAALFFIQEFYQMYRFVITNAAIAYWLDLWNWIDLITIILVAASAIKFQQEDDSVRIDRLLITTGFFQFVFFVSYLKKTFFPFSKFVSGIIKIFWDILPFQVISIMTLFAFSFMYYVREKDSDLYPYDLAPQNSTNPYDLLKSFKTVWSPFAPGPLEDGSEHLLDFLFGITIIIILLNVVIAIVNEAWEDASDEADKAFWNYRLDLILEKTRGIDNGGIFPAVFYKGFNGLDEFYINIDTVGTTIDELKEKLSLTYRMNGSFFCLLVILKSLGFVILGFPTLGILWPKFVRQILFTPPTPKEDETKTQIAHLLAEFDEFKSNIDGHREEVKKLGQNKSFSRTRSHDDVGRWLASHLPSLETEDIEKYCYFFVEDGFDSIDMLKDVEEGDLVFMKKAHRRALMKRL